MGIPFSTTQTQLAQNKQKINPLLFSDSSLSENNTFSCFLFHTWLPFSALKIHP
ncbi:hypothetical protein OpiT1DRAFT_00433 [Opitutaceae bacterium TAV1]|nr:hypothetical protein OpiT1DRAFT_00433 [Opitutaceae bacterium TAV1]